MLWFQLGQSFLEAQRACLLTRIPFISSCQSLWERDSYVTMTSNNTKYTGFLPFWKKQLYPYKLAHQIEKIYHASPPHPQKNQALPLGHLVTQISDLKITKLGTSQCLCDSPKCLNIWKYADVGYQVHSSRGLTHILATGECQIASWSKISWNSKKSARGNFGVNKADPIGYNFLRPQGWFRSVCLGWFAPWTPASLPQPLL